MDTDWPRDSFHCMNFGILVFSRYMATSMPFSPFDQDCNSFCYVLILPLTCMLCLGQAWLCACLFIMFFKPFTASARLFAVSAAFSIFSARVIFPSLAKSFLFSDFFVAGFFLCCLLPAAPFSKECLLPFGFFKLDFMADFPFDKDLANFPFDKGFAFIDVLAFGAILCDGKGP